MVEYTFFGGPPDYVINAVRSNLTPSLHWNAVKVHDPVLNMVATAAARAFQSSYASNNEEWLEVAAAYLLKIHDCVKLLKMWPKALRFIVHCLSPHRTAIRDQWARARRVVAESMRLNQENGSGSIDSPPTMLHYCTSGKNSAYANDVDLQLRHQMTLVSVGTLTTFGTTVQCLYDLATHAECQDELREEVTQAPRDTSGFFIKEALSSMKRLDSFMKEVQRLYSPDLSESSSAEVSRISHVCLYVSGEATFQRATVTDMTLPDGTYLPKGTKLETATCSIHVDERNYDDATTFNPFRFYNKRQQEGEENKHLFVSVSPDDMSFGFGRHACPGRFFSHTVIKCFLAEFLLNYDVRLPDGHSRPKNLEFQTIVEPDPDAVVLLRRRV
ncbi:hypothetical protein G7054_g12744 [Neopestalotiopsis clavispora]|nr:hypothetical protein G7054_g12744 [Neopestalotiopsis clavispora]